MLDTIPAFFFARDGKKLGVAAYAFLALLCFAFFTPGIATLPPTDRDESLFAQASKQMVESGNYTDIRVQDAPRYKKPIGIYWLQSASARALGAENLDEIFAYRLPSFFGATVAVLMTAALGELLFSPIAGLLAAMMLAGCVLMNVEARLATTDAALLASIVCAMYALAKAALTNAPDDKSSVVFKAQMALKRLFRRRSGEDLSPDKEKGVSTRHILLFWVAVAAGILIKGPIVLLPVAGVLLWFNTADKTIKWFLKLRPLFGVPFVLALVAPWFVAIMMQSHGAFVQQSAGNDMLAKIWQGQNRGMLPPGLHFLAMPFLFFPYSLFAFFALPYIWKNRRDGAIKFCLGWIVPMWIVFELSMTKLPHYVLPAYPAIALLTARFLTDNAPLYLSNRTYYSWIAGLWLIVGTGFAFFFGGILPSLSDKTFALPELAAAIVLLLLQGYALAQFMTKKVASALVLTLAGLVFLPMTFGYLLPHLKHIWLSRQIVEAAAKIAPCETVPIVSLGYHEPSLVFMAGTDTILARSASEATDALKQNACRIAVVAASNRQEFLDASASSPITPKEVAVIDGFNSGRGKNMTVSLYLAVSKEPHER